jgi:hypothetical protein
MIYFFNDKITLWIFETNVNENLLQHSYMNNNNIHSL